MHISNSEKDLILSMMESKDVKIEEEAETPPWIDEGFCHFLFENKSQ